MTEAENTHKIEELERLLNDPTVPLDAPKVWLLAHEVACAEADCARADK